jgi:phosphatidylglycerophosphatase C
MQVVLFDLDHTLIRCDSFSGFLRAALLRHPLRAAAAISTLPLVGGLYLVPRLRVPAVSVLIWIATVGLDQAALDELMEGHVAAVFGAEPSLTCRAAVAALNAHVEAGARVVVVTGAAAALAERVCRRIGAQPSHVIGSTLQPLLGGWVAHRHCYGPRKVRMAHEHGLGPRWDCVYTDSASDLPILVRSERRVLVNPRPQDRARVHAALGATFEIVEWR